VWPRTRSRCLISSWCPLSAAGQWRCRFSRHFAVVSPHTISTSQECCSGSSHKTLQLFSHDGEFTDNKYCLDTCQHCRHFACAISVGEPFVVAHRLVVRVVSGRPIRGAGRCALALFSLPPRRFELEIAKIPSFPMYERARQVAVEGWTCPGRPWQTHQADESFKQFKCESAAVAHLGNQMFELGSSSSLYQWYQQYLSDTSALQASHNKHLRRQCSLIVNHRLQSMIIARVSEGIVL
jgi:hypothetical protein